jgi:hypothetical protein
MGRGYNGVSQGGYPPPPPPGGGGGSSFHAKGVGTDLAVPYRITILAYCYYLVHQQHLSLMPSRLASI